MKRVVLLSTGEMIYRVMSKCAKNINAKDNQLGATITVY